VEPAPIYILHIVYITITLFGILLVLGRPSCKALALLLGVHLIEEALNIYEELHAGQGVYLITPALQIAYGPLYYLFAKNLIYGDLNIRRHAIHLLPALIAVGFTRWWPVELMIAFAVLVIYFVPTYKLLYRYHLVLRDLVANDEAHSLKWLIKTLAVIGAFAFIDFIRLNLQQTLSFELLTRWYFVSTLVSFLCIAYLILKAVRQPELYSGISDIEQRIAASDAVKPSPTQADVDMAETLFAAIVKHQRQYFGYRRPKYSLRNLSDEMELTEQSLSWAINTGGQKNFSDFINDLRIEDVKQLLRQGGDNQNILDIAFKAGFNSKSSFNAVFKKHVGMTPSQYANQSA
jgi:AraC-like DNA-binding protein